VSVLVISTRCSYTVITVATKTHIVRIGNSRGIRIPKTLLDEADLPEEVELHAQPGRLIVQAAHRPRSGWASAAKRMRTRGDDAVLDDSTATKFDRAEWKWR
jgi:antitoxin MazE